MGVTILCVVLVCVAAFFYHTRNVARADLLHLQQVLRDRRGDLAALENEHLALRTQCNDLLSARRLETIFATLPRTLSERYAFHYVWIDTLPSHGQESLAFAGGFNGITGQTGNPLMVGTELSAHVLATGKALLCRNRMHQTSVSWNMMPNEVSTLLSLPLGTEKRNWGVLHLAHDREHPLAHGCLEDLKLLAGLVSVVVEHLRAEAALRAAEAERRSLNMLLPDAAVTFTPTGTITEVNAHFEDLTGFRAHEVVGTGIDRLLPLPHGVQAEGEGALPAGERRLIGIPQEVDMHHKEGRRIPVELTLHESQVGGRLVYTGLMRDASERRTRQQELAAERGRAAQADQARRKFLVNLNHALRTPLTGIMGMADLLTETALEGEQRGYVFTLADSAQGLLENLEGLMEAARDPETRPGPAPYAPRRLLEDLGDLMATRLGDREVDLYVNVDPAVPAEAEGRAGLLRQALQHLAVRLLHDMGDGRLVCSVAPAEEGTTGLCYRLWGAPCVPDARTADVLADVPLVAAADPVGLAEGFFNLHIARDLCRAMGATVAFVREAGGARFTLRVPADGARKPGLRSALLANVRGLLIAPDEVSAGALENLLRPYGCVPERAASAAAGVARVREAAATDTPFDLLIAPVWLGDEASRALLAGLRHDPAYARTHHILHCPLHRREAALRVLPSPSVSLVTHPIKQKRLIELVLKCRKQLLAEEMGEEPPPARGVRGRVLVVEDNDINQRLILKVLEREGCDFTLAPDGEAAVAAAARDRFDLILMDINLPRLNGFQATEQIRAVGQNTDTDIIAMTADVVDTDLARCLAHGMNGMLPKPIRVQELVTLMTRTFAKRGIAPGAATADPGTSEA